MNILCSLRERGRLKNTFEIGVSIDDVNNKIVSAHCIVTSHIMKTENDLYFQSCQFMFRGLKVHIKRFHTVAFHFIIVQINIKESYIR